MIWLMVAGKRSLRPGVTLDEAALLVVAILAFVMALAGAYGILKVLRPP